MKNSRHRRRAKTVLRLPDLEHAKSAVLNTWPPPNLDVLMNSRFKTSSSGIVQSRGSLSTELS